MEKMFQTFRYLSKSFRMVIVTGFLVILSGVAVTDLVYFLTNHYSMVNLNGPLTVPFESISGIFALLNGLVLFTTNFKVALANGISRKTFLLANLPTAAITAVAFSVFNLVVVLIHGLFCSIQLISSLIYPDIGWAGLLILQFVLYFLLIEVGWFITLAYYRSSTMGKWVISLTPLVLFILLQQDNIRGGAITNEIRNYLSVSMVSPYRASAFMIVYAAILFGLVYLLFRRAPLKD